MVLQYIKKLLYVHECVVIPDFGGFITSYLPASIHPVKHLFRPPSKQIAFNESLKTNDGLLAHEISVGEQITREEAAEHIREFVKSVESALAVDRMIVLDEIGTLRLNEEDKIEFEPTDHVNFLEESYGFTELYCKPVERKEEDMNKRPYPPQNRAVPPGRQPVRRKPNPEKAKQKAEKDMNEEKKQGNKTSPALIVVPIIVLLLVAVAVSLYYIDDGKYYKQIASMGSSDTSQEADASSMDDARDESDDADKEALAAAGDAGDDTKNTDEASVTSDESTKMSSAGSAEGNIHIIAGVFKKKENALEMQNKYSGAELIEYQDYYRVSVTRYDNVDDAIDDIESLRADYGPNAWILKQ